MQVFDIERDIKLAKSGKEDLVYKTLIGLKADLSKPATVPEILSKKPQAIKVRFDGKVISSDTRKDSESEESGGSSYDDSDEGSDDENEEDSDGEKESKFVNSARPKHETTEEKKVHPRLLKTLYFNLHYVYDK